MIYLIISILSILGLMCIVYIYSKIQAINGLLKILHIAIDNRDKIIDKMASQMTTDYHNVEWVKKYYVAEVNNDMLREKLNGSRRSDKNMSNNR